MVIDILKKGRIFGPTLGLMYPIQEVAMLWFPFLKDSSPHIMTPSTTMA
jgi:hypothetical protein